jgi:hypothetical protein
MCGRITQKSPPNQLGLKIVSLIEPLDVPPRYNGAPGQEQWVIRQNPKTGERTLNRLWWGLIPHWVTDHRYPRKGARFPAPRRRQQASNRVAPRRSREDRSREAPPLPAPGRTRWAEESCSSSTAVGALESSPSYWLYLFRFTKSPRKLTAPAGHAARASHPACSRGDGDCCLDQNRNEGRARVGISSGNAQHHGPTNRLKTLAGAPGFEPGNGGIKTCPSS